MNSKLTGNLIARLRIEHGLTQRALSQALHITDKAVSKWECGLGCPDVSLLGPLAAVLGVTVEQLLAGDTCEQSPDGGNMKRIQFYLCPVCGNVLTATGPADVACCGRVLAPLPVCAADDLHRPTRETVEGELYLSFAHEMTKQHFLQFIVCVRNDRLLLVRLYPEQEPALRLPAAMLRGAKLYAGCSQHGLFLL